MRVAEALKALRDSIKMTRAEASALADTAPSAEVLERWESGEETPDVMSLNAYLEVLGYDFHDLQNALEGIDASPETVPVDWLDEFMGTPEDNPEVRAALAKTLERLDQMYAGRLAPDEVRWLRTKLEAQQIRRE